ALLATPTLGGAQPDMPARDAAKKVDFAAGAAAARDLLGALVAADTTNPPGNEARAVALGKQRLEQAGIPFRVTEFAPGRENLVARLPGDGSARPLLLIAHVDVVGTDGQDWSTNPRKMTDIGGYLVGRGVADDFGMAALALQTLILLKQHDVPLVRDVIVAWTGDEESGGAGVRWILEHEPESIAAEIALNEGGGLSLDDQGRPKLIQLQTAEKQYQDFTITARGTTGHSSVPRADNAIYALSAGLAKLATHRFAPRLLPVTRAYFENRAPLEEPEVAAAMRALAASGGELPADALAVLDKDPTLAATLRTTCVATMLSGGSRVNALPAKATANVNCRILPGESVADVQSALQRALGDPKLEVTPTNEFGFGEPSELSGPGPLAIRAVVEQMWPGLPIVPFMSRGATDSRFLRAKGIHSYGINPIGLTDDDENRMHGIDERIPAASLQPGLEFLYRLVLELAAKKS
ncbi:M20/M25/M40 family metallo-hydrolase, partial [Candidatus Binatia bacterium]|nr:M20/M25/M40 family metallo-hydrolase [Candidatus Binatia bacterium]